GRMSFFLQRFQREEQAGVEAGRRIVGEAEIDGDAIRGLEADAVDFTGHPVGFMAEYGLGLGSVMADEPDALRRRDTVGLEKNIKLPLCPLLVPGPLDRGGALRADAGHTPQPGRLFA